MRRIISTLIVYLSVVVIAVSSLTSCGPVAGRGGTPPQLRIGLDGVSYQPDQPDVWELPNGLTVLYMHDPELPLVRGALYVRGGSLWEPNALPGITGAMGDQMRQGGAGKRAPEALDRELEELAASVGSTVGAEFGKVSFAGLESDFEQIFSIFADVALRPRFDADRLDLWKGQALESIRRRTDDPGTIAGIAFNQLLYGDTPYGKVPVDVDVRAISRAQLVELHSDFMQPQRSLLVISGSVPRPVVATLVERYFGDWRRGSGELPPPPPVDWKPTPGIYFLSYPFAQSTIFIGHLGPRRLTPDYPAIDGFNELFGSSGFSARLTKRVRTELGLAYGIFGAVVPAVVKGRNLVQLQTKSESTGLGVVESIDVLQNMQKELVSADELNEARRSITNSFVFKFDSTDELVQRAALLRLLDYPLDYDATYVDKIESLTPEDIRTAAKAHWDPSQFVLVVVGNETAYTSLEKAAKEHPALLGQFPIRRMRFDQKLVF